MSSMPQTVREQYELVESLKAESEPNWATDASQKKAQSKPLAAGGRRAFRECAEAVGADEAKGRTRKATRRRTPDTRVGRRCAEASIARAATGPSIRHAHVTGCCCRRYVRSGSATGRDSARARGMSASSQYRPNLAPQGNDVRCH